MSDVNAVEIAYQLIQEVEKGGVYVPNESVLTRLINLCELVDTLLEDPEDESEFEDIPAVDSDDASICVDVSPEKPFSFVSMEVDDIIFENGSSNPFFEVTKENASSIAFSKAESGLLEIKFTVRGLWVKK